MKLLPLLDSEALEIYLTDHHAGSTAGLELAKRARDSNEDNSYGEFLAELSDEIAEDRNELEAIMQALGVERNLVKVTVAAAAERLGRLKPNGSLLSYAPLSRVVELEGLITGVSGKLALWESLLEVVPHEARLDGPKLERLKERAESQLSRLRVYHREAARDALCGDDSG